MELIKTIWRRAHAEQPAPEPVIVAAVAGLAAVLVLSRTAWPVTRHLVTISHEGGHAVAAVLTGRRLAGIRLHSDTSGVTVSSGRTAGPGMVIMLSAGYLAPAVAGMAAALLLVAGHAAGLLWLLAGWLGLMMLQIRNPYGLLMLLVSGGGLVAVSYTLPGTAISLVAYLLTWVLLIAAPKPVLELARQRRRRPTPQSDVDQLARLTRVPARLWLAGFLLANLVGLAIGAATLVPALAAMALNLGGSVEGWLG